jgi:hypothetical protein
LPSSTPHDLKAKKCKKPPHRKFQYWVLVLETQVLVLKNSGSSFLFFIFFKLKILILVSHTHKGSRNPTGLMFEYFKII